MNIYKKLNGTEACKVWMVNLSSTLIQAVININVGTQSNSIGSLAGVSFQNRDEVLEKYIFYFERGV